MIKIERLHHLQICVPVGAEPQVRDFYGGILGLTEIPRPESLGKGGLWFQAGDVELHIGVESCDGSPSKRHPAFAVADVRAARRYLESLHIAIREEPLILGRTRFSFHDPFGNRVEFLQDD